MQLPHCTSITDLSITISNWYTTKKHNFVEMGKMDLSEISEKIQNKFKVLREKGTNKPLGVAYTEDGLKWLSNKTGKALYFKNARFGEGQLLGDTEKSTRVYVEDFIPRLEEKNKHRQLEINWMAKASKMLY